MRVILGCERFCRVRDEFLRRGFDAWSCDTEEDVIEEYGGPHWQGDVLDILDGKNCGNGTPWRLGIFFPPCTFLCSSGLHWNKRVEGRAKKTEMALEFVAKLIAAPIESIAVENPRGCITTRLASLLKQHGFRAQTIQPYDFGEDASKATVILRKNLPALVPTKRVSGRWVQHNGKRVERWSNQTDSGQNRLGPSEERAAERGKTYRGIAVAMADQWGHFIKGFA